MKDENDDIAKLLYFREYVPRVIEYAIMGLISLDKSEVILSNNFRKEMLNSFFRILSSTSSSLNTKLKLIILILPQNMRKIVGKLYIKYQDISDI